MTLAALKPDPLFEAAPVRRVRGQVVLVATWLLVTGIGLWLHADPRGHGTHKQLGLAACPSAALFGRPCPGCGLTTSWTALLHGDLPASFRAHLFGPMSYVLFTAVSLLSLYALLTRRRLVVDSVGANRLLALFALVFFGYGAWRFATQSDYATPGEKLYRQAYRSAIPSSDAR